MPRRLIQLVIVLLSVLLLVGLTAAYYPFLLPAKIQGLVAPTLQAATIAIIITAVVSQLVVLSSKVRNAENEEFHTTPQTITFAEMQRRIEAAELTEAASPRERLAVELKQIAKVDELKASRALWLVPAVVIGGVVLSNVLDSPSFASNAELAYALIKRIGTLGVTFYLAHAAVSQYRYSTLRAAHYRACSQAILVSENDRTLIQVYRMLAPAQAFGASPTSPVDALVKIAAGKDADK